MDAAVVREALMGLSLLAGMPEDVRVEVAEALVGVSELVAPEKGKALFQEGAIGGARGYVLLTGAVVVNREGAEPVQVSAPAVLGEMQQFSLQQYRTATVTVSKSGYALAFDWADFYARARSTLGDEAQGMLLAQIERLVWDRVHSGAVLDVAFFRALPKDWRVRAALLLVWVARPRDFPAGAVLFEEGRPCAGAGYLLIKGSVSLSVSNRQPHVVRAPDLIGVHSEFDPDRRWTATARAMEDVAAYLFSWQEYTVILQRRLDPEAYETFLDIARRAREHHFAN